MNAPSRYSRVLMAVSLLAISGLLFAGVRQSSLPAAQAQELAAGTPAAPEMRWSVEADLAMPADQVAGMGGSGGVVNYLLGQLGGLIEDQNVVFSAAPGAEADGQAFFLVRIEGSGGLDQFRQAAYVDVEPLFRLLGGTVSLELAGNVAAGQSLPLVLQSFPSTGSTWSIEAADTALLESPANPDLSPAGSGIGAASYETFNLQALSDGLATIRLAYHRPFGPQESPTRRVTIQAPDLGSVLNLTSPSIPSLALPTLPMAAEGAPAGDSLLGLPSSFDWRSSGDVTPIRNQANCGSCWAFATVGIMESALLIQGDTSTDLSEQYLVSCNLDTYSCSGGWYSHQYHTNTWGASGNPPGAVLESDFPYAALDLPCTVTYDHPYILDSWSLVGGTTPSVDAIKNAIYTHGPVAASMCVGSAFQGYTGGVFSTDESATCASTNHAVVLVGWDDATQTWILRNSWGTYWGESGYMRIVWGTSRIGYYANYVVYTGLPPVPPANDDFDAATVITGDPTGFTTQETESTNLATSDSDDPTFSCTGGARYHTVWYSFTPTWSGTLTLDTFGSNYDTVLAVWSGMRGSLVSEGCNDDTAGLQSYLQVPLDGGIHYYIEVAGYWEFDSGDLTLNLTWQPDLPPTPTATATASTTPTATSTATPTSSPTATATPTSTPTVTATPTITLTPTPTPIFGDVPDTYWAHDYIEALYNAGFVVGCSANPRLYCPDRILSRAESAVFVERGHHGAIPDPPYPTPSSPTFADVPASFWGFGWIESLWQDGYTAGCTIDPPLDYCPDRQHTRAEGSVFFLRIKYGATYTPPPGTGIFADVLPGDWFYDWAEAAYNEGLLPACGIDPLAYCPNSPLDRAWAAYMMVQAKGGLPLP